MKHTIKRIAAILCTAGMVAALAACGPGAAEEEGGGTQTSLPPSNLAAAGARQPAVLDLSGATAITLSGGGASVNGKGAEAEGGVVTITAAGVYAVSGCLEDGRIIVNAPKEEVTVALNGADITCSYGSPLYIYKAGEATVHLMEGTQNALTDGAVYTFDDEYSSAADEEPNACLYSKADLVIEGAGTLTVTANYDNGITGKDTLQIYDGVLSVQAVNNGVNGKDSNTIDSAWVSVACGGDAIRSTNDTDQTLGWISVSNSILELTAGEDGIQAETALSISDGSYTIVSGGGSAVEPSDDVSAKGIKAGTTLTLTGGAYTLDCSDDGIHSNGDVTISGGTYSISTGDDAVHADQDLTVSAGEIHVLTSYEGLEGTRVSISGGEIRIVSSDDGVNAAGGADGSGFGGFDRGNAFGGGNPDCCIDISGGYLVVEAGGDGLDSNGNTVMSGGTVIVSSTGRADGALDYDGSFTLTGGTLLAVSSGNMAQSPSEASQQTLFLGFDSLLPGGTYVSLAGEEQSFVFELPADANSVVFSSPELEGGGVYALSCGGTYNGRSVDGICSDGVYSGGTDLAELTLSDAITLYGSAGMGGRPGGARGDMPGGNRGEPPADGMGPGPRPDGEGHANMDMREGPWSDNGQDGMPEGRDQFRREPSGDDVPAS